MLKQSILITSTILLLYWGCSPDGCPRKVPSYPLLPQMERYFGNYKPDNYWIYLNQDSTKRDSVFVSNYYYTKSKNLLLCIELESKEFTLVSQYLSAQKNLDVRYLPHNGYSINNFEITSKAIDFAIFIEGKKEVDSLAIPGGVTGLSINRAYNFTLPYNPQLVLPEVTIVHRPNAGRVVFAPDVGIVQYITNYYQDTFTLVKYHIQ